ncbi:hypothetical protein BBJ28_00026983 [Nothophytophthora sp. Chile5]|nr:hypothetical protein BBJ28_00026983 [Nothophytophthora sp. Chile5]
MRLRHVFVAVPATDAVATDPASRELLAIVATPDAADDEAEASGGFDEVLVYLHGFPDMAVHPAKATFASRMPSKLAEFWLQRSQPHPRAAFIAFNFGGVPGSDSHLRFADKAISKELEDAVAVCKYARRHLLQSDSVDAPPGKLHVVGLSTGAIVASLLRDQQVADSITVIAGLLDLAGGVQFDFSPLQLEQCAASGMCWKEFYLPQDCPLPKNAELSLDGVHPTTELTDSGSDRIPGKLYVRLNQRYVHECQDGSLDIRRAVSGTSLPPLLVVHGDADKNVPFHNGEELFAAAAEPKTFLAIPRANHLLSNSKHLKRAMRAIEEHVAVVQ